MSENLVQLYSNYINTVPFLIESKQIGSFKGTTIDRQLAAGMALIVDPNAKKRRRKRTWENRKKLRKRLDVLQDNLIAVYRKYKMEEPEDPKKYTGPQNITRTQLYKRIRNLLKHAYKEAYKLGIASGESLDAPLQQDLRSDEKGWVESFRRHEGRYLNQLIANIVHDNSKTNVEYRLGRYSKTVMSIFDAARVMTTAPINLIAWKKHPAEHCESCNMLARHSPYTVMTLPTTPKAGATICLDNCMCTLEFHESTPEKVLLVQEKNVKAKTMISKLLKLKR